MTPPVQFVKAVRAQKEPQVQQGCCRGALDFQDIVAYKGLLNLCNYKRMHGTLMLS